MCSLSPQEIFHRLFHEEHWALQHQAMESLLAFSRFTEVADFRKLIPGDVYSPTQGSEHPFIQLMTSYMKRQVTGDSQVREEGVAPSPSAEAMALKMSMCQEEWAESLCKTAEEALQALGQAGQRVAADSDQQMNTAANKHSVGDCVDSSSAIREGLDSIRHGLDRLQQIISVVAAHRESLDEAARQCHTMQLVSLLQELRGCSSQMKILEAQIE